MHNHENPTQVSPGTSQPTSYNPFPPSSQPPAAAYPALQQEPPLIPQQQFYYQYVNSGDPQLTAAAIAMAEENAALREREKLRDEAERARQEIFTNSDGCTYVQGKSGKLILLAPFQFSECMLVIPDKRFGIAPFYRLSFNVNHFDKIELSEKDFHDAGKLLDRIQAATKMKINYTGSRMRTAYLVRQAALVHFREVCIPFYGGWQKLEESWKFLQFNELRTHQKTGSLEIWRELEQMTAQPAFVSSATTAFCRRFRSVKNPVLRGALFLWAHAAFLHSLLDGLGYRCGLALNLLCDSPKTASYCTSLLTLYRDAPVSLTLPGQIFKEALLARKDQPVILRDQRGFSEAADNARVVREVLASGYIPASNQESYPIQAPLAILSQSVTDLTCSPFCLTMDVTKDDFVSDSALRDESGRCNDDYFAAFAHYVEDHIGELENDLSESKTVAGCLEEESSGLSQVASDTFAVFLGLRTFLTGFYNQDAVTTDLQDIFPEGWNSAFLCDLENTSDRADQTDLANQFLEAAREMIVRKELEVKAPKDICDRSYQGVVADTDWVCFTGAAMQQVCANLAFSKPFVIDALVGAGLLCGQAVNQATRLTRITVGQVGYVRNQLRVFKLRRSDFEPFGESIIPEVE